MLEIRNPSLASLTTLHLGGNALTLLVPECVEDLPLLAERSKILGATLYPIGKGSNILAREGQLPIALVRLDAFNDLKISWECGETVYVRAEAGVPLKRLLRFCLEHELSGLEGLVGIPGNVGGACAMNAGSFGMEFGAKIHALEAWSGQKLQTFQACAITLQYRKLTMRNCKEFPLVMAVIFALTRSIKEAIFQRMNLNYLEKKSRQPLGVWSAGCAFKNPCHAPSAGKLLDEAGFRGKYLGGMYFSAKHANFLVNDGSGTSAQAFEIMEEAREAVKRLWGVILEPEIRVIS